MTDRTRPGEQAATLASVLERARRAAPRGVVVCDLDSTLLDNRPRQARILQDYGRMAGLPELLDARPEHWQGWSLETALRNAGLPEAAIQAHALPARRYWAEWFFSSAYCRLDVPMPGAPGFARSIVGAGALLAYVTGRPLGMEAGTREVLRNHGFPIPDGRTAHLLLKPERALPDDAWKVEAARQVDRLGEVVAAFDNEPLHVNAYARAWPRALVVHVATDDSGRPVEVLPGIPSVEDFER